MKRQTIIALGVAIILGLAAVLIANVYLSGRERQIAAATPARPRTAGTDSAIMAKARVVLRNIGLLPRVCGTLLGSGLRGRHLRCARLGRVAGTGAGDQADDLVDLGVLDGACRDRAA